MNYDPFEHDRAEHPPRRSIWPGIILGVVVLAAVAAVAFFRRVP